MIGLTVSGKTEGRARAVLCVNVSYLTQPPGPIVGNDGVVNGPGALGWERKRFVPGGGGGEPLFKPPLPLALGFP